MLLPNQLTTLRIILTPFFAYFFVSSDPLFKKISLIIFLIAALTDWYDGWLARKLNYFTTFGRYMDPLADKILVSTAFLCLVYDGILELWMVLIIVLRDLLVTILRSVGEFLGEAFVTTKIAKWKTALQMVFLYYLLIIYIAQFEKQLQPYNDIIQTLLNKDFVYYTMLVITILTFYTGIHYFVTNYKILIKVAKKFYE